MLYCVCVYVFAAFCCLVFFAICLFVCLSRFCQRIYEWQRGFHLLWRPFCLFVRQGAPPFVCRMTARCLPCLFRCSRCCSLCAPCAALFMQAFSLAAPLQRHCHQSAQSQLKLKLEPHVAYSQSLSQSSAFFDPFAWRSH